MDGPHDGANDSDGGGIGGRQEDQEGEREASEQIEQEVDDRGGVRVSSVPARGRGRGRAGRPRTRTIEEGNRGRRRLDTAYAWSSVGRDEFDRTQSMAIQRFERGEGGGVT